ncbi:MAG: hypothetical protein ABF242_05405 [Flavobacteriales bacterium]
MKNVVLFIGITLLISSCFLKKRNSFLYKTAVKISKNKGIFEVSLPEELLSSFKYKAQVELLDEDGEIGGKELFERNVLVYSIEKTLMPSLFSRDLSFTSFHKSHKIDSISYRITFLDSIQKDMVNPSEYYFTTPENQSKIFWSKNLVEDVIIYSGKREYHFMDSFLWSDEKEN